jgi:hypothetical protein
MCGCLAGQPDSSTARPRSIRKDQPIIDLASAAAVLPPELAADGLIQLAHSEAPSDKKLAVAWLEDAFRLAKQATFPYRVVTLSGIAATSDSTAGIVQLSLEPGLDALSLRSRSIREMLRFDRQKAREMFDEITSVVPPPLTCTSATGFSLSLYYTTALAIERDGFSPMERSRGLVQDFVRGLVSRIGSPFQLLPLQQTLVLEASHARDADEVLTSYAIAVGNLRTDDRSFTATTTPALFQSLHELVAACRSRGASPAPMLNAFRQYFERQLAQEQCRDNLSAGTDQSILRVVQSLNDLLAAFTPDQPAVRLDNTRPAQPSDKADITLFWDSPSTKQLLARLRHLRFGDGESGAVSTSRLKDGRTPYLGVADRSTSSWTGELQDFLEAFSQWQAQSEEPPQVKFHEAADIYENLIELIPISNAARSNLLDEYIAFLKSSSVEASSPPEWLLHLKRLLQGRDAPDRSAILARVKAQGDSAMTFYVEFEDLVNKGLIVK